MDFFKSGIKTVLGTSELSEPPSPAETVERLVDRVTSSTLLEDRRDACRALRALSRKYRVEVGAQGMPAFLQVLQNDSSDPEIIDFALTTLCNIVATEDFSEEEETPVVSVNVGEQFTEMLIKNPDNVTLIMNFLEEYDFRVRRSAIMLITMLISNKTREMQEIILVSPMGVSKLMDLLTDSREIIRNDALLLLIQLTKSNSNIQKIVAFENAFDKIFEIIISEGCSDGGIVVEDCLILLLNLLKNNSSNQQFFKEGSYIQRLSPMFSFDTESEDALWTPQKVSNVHCLLQVVRSLVTPSNQHQVVNACQNTMRQCGLLSALCTMLMSSGVPADILTETINSVAEVIRGNRENQFEFSKAMAPSNPPRTAIVVLLMTMINDKQMLALRCAVLYTFQCYLCRNEVAQRTVVQTLLPSSVEGVSNWSTGQILCTGLFANDAMANWFAAVSLMHTLVDNTQQKEELLRVLLATPGGHKPIKLLEQCTNLLQQDSYNFRSKIGLLMLLSTWMAHCPIAVRTFLGTLGTMAYLTARITANEHDEDEHLIQGMCAFLMGLCIQFNDNTIVGQKRDDICQLVIKRIGQENFYNKLSEVSRNEAYSRACKQPQIRAKCVNELILDFEYCKMYKGLEALIGKVVSGFDVDGIELTELTLSSEASALVAQYKGIIRGLDSQINNLQERVNDLESKNSTLENQLDLLKTTNSQLTDQNTLLKAQLAAIQKGLPNTADLNENCQQESPSKLQTNRNNEERIHFQRELDELRELLKKQTQRAENAESELQTVKKDQEDLLELLSDQEGKIELYENLISSAGLKETPSNGVSVVEMPIKSSPINGQITRYICSLYRQDQSKESQSEIQKCQMLKFI